MLKRQSIKVLLCRLAAGLCLCVPLGVDAETRTWVSVGSRNFGNASNWDPSGAPASGDTIIFDDSSAVKCDGSMDQSTKVFHLDRKSTHEGQIGRATSPFQYVSALGTSVVTVGTNALDVHLQFAVGSSFIELNGSGSADVILYGDDGGTLWVTGATNVTLVDTCFFDHVHNMGGTLTWESSSTETSATVIRQTSGTMTMNRDLADDVEFDLCGGTFTYTGGQPSGTGNFHFIEYGGTFNLDPDEAFSNFNCRLLDGILDMSDGSLDNDFSAGAVWGPDLSVTENVEFTDFDGIDFR
jgi:hypothetical protein